MIRLEGLTKIYNNGGNEVRAVDNVSYCFGDGLFTAVMGKSGSGKSTLLHLIGGLEDATGGKITVDGNDITAYGEKALSKFRRENIGFVFQFFHLVPELTVGENIALALNVAKMKPDTEYFSELTEMLELSDRLSHLPSQISGGQRQRAAIARALITKPKYLLLDEPTGNLDSACADAVMRSVVTLRRRFGQTVILVTHDKDVASCSDVVVRMCDGRLSL